MSLAIVIPVLNETRNLPRLLREVSELERRGVAIVFVDGGSVDGSPARLRAAGATVLAAATGRARQMNAGAAVAGREVLMFLHADTELPLLADVIVARALAHGRAVWGRFDVRIAGRSCLLQVVAFTMNLRARVTGIATGDQAMFVTRAAFDAVGGFPDQPLMEDVELSRRLRRLSWPLCLRDKVTTSGRRWETRGVVRTVLLMWRLRFAYWRGENPSALAARYR